jgi:hypothetical protein
MAAIFNSLFLVILALVARIHRSACEMPNRARIALVRAFLLVSKWPLATSARVTSVVPATESTQTA